MIPGWLEKRYEILRGAYQDSAFRFDDAARILKDKMQDSEEQINLIPYSNR